LAFAWHLLLCRIKATVQLLAGKPPCEVLLQPAPSSSYGLIRARTWSGVAAAVKPRKRPSVSGVSRWPSLSKKSFLAVTLSNVFVADVLK
jgi:hypothetical protein